jgi:hypothetical protein
MLYKHRLKFTLCPKDNYLDYKAVWGAQAIDNILDLVAIMRRTQQRIVD